LATLKEIKVRINAVKSTQKITKAMKMVAAAKLRRAQDRITSARPYALKLNELLTQLLSTTDKIVNPLMEKREGGNVLVVLVTADRGLCGSFNTNLIKAAANHLQNLGSSAQLICVGKKGYDIFKNRNVNMIEHFSGIFNNLNIDLSNEIVNRIVKGYLNREYDRVEIIYNEFKSVIKQVIRIEQFLPLVRKEKAKDEKAKKLDYIYEPDVESILNDIIPKQLNIQLWKSLLESNAAEQGARMTAMETASKNASDLIKELDLQYNRARQEAITKEILEIVSGAEALKES